MKIEQQLPTAVLRSIQNIHSPLARLILSGYVFRSSVYDTEASQLAEVYPEYSLQQDINNPGLDSDATIFLAKEGALPIGSLTMIKLDRRSRTGEPIAWLLLERDHPQLAAKTYARGSMMCEVGGIVVDPRVRNRGVARALLTKAVSALQPSVIVGQTKTVEAVMTRRSLPGYRTFFGRTEVTKDEYKGNTVFHWPYMNAYKGSNFIHSLQVDPTLHFQNGNISPYIPDVSGCPSSVQEAFRDLIRIQTETGDWKTVMSTLISVRDGIL